MIRACIWVAAAVVACGTGILAMGVGLLLALANLSLARVLFPEAAILNEGSAGEAAFMLCCCAVCGVGGVLALARVWRAQACGEAHDALLTTLDRLQL